ncbi:potassium channel family protein [uncultured Psychrosphaera sp.]|jgi:hypothetical protein|uniref:potassium channel family protein n=1 Tax=uncultured Psychrosphaera sp. TaxID=1403522 RepID=UPI00262308BB|nr:potassium channel family protein [uncultured Psychrosphaera sp.]
MFSVFFINCLVIVIVVLVHYQFLYRIVKFLPKMHVKHSFRIVFGVFGALVAHVIEIWIFGIAFYWMDITEGWGHLVGNVNGQLMDCVYFSFTVYTTVGFGDIEPHGPLRYLTGIESLTGLMLITWTASFLYLEMQRYWSQDLNVD